MTNLLTGDYVRGMDYLDLVAPIFANFVRAMGRPHDNPNIPTACVKWDAYNKRISFEMNSEFTSTLSDEAMAAAMAHETYHVLLNHLHEVRDRKAYPRNQVLVIAHECIINDGLKANVGVELPDGFWSGVKSFEQDFSYFSTKQAYDFIVDKLQEQEEENKSQEGEEGSSGQGQAGGGQASSGQGNSSGGGQGDKTEDSSDETPSDGSGNGDEKGEDDGQPQGCGGFDIQDMDPQDIADFQKAVQSIMQDVVDQVGEENLPDDLADMAAEVLGDGFGRGGTKKTMFYSASPLDNLELNWAEILTIINPRVLSKGKPKPKENWQRVPRRLTAVYPEVILPDRRMKLDDPNGRGKELPTFVIALDLSGSIPRTLVNTLMKLVDSIPVRLISPRPITWSDGVQEYDERKLVVGAGGTEIDAVYRYANEVAKEIGSDPYVLVITDGQCAFYRQVDTCYLKERWFWCAIQPQAIHSINANFVGRGHANPKYVYKLSDLSR